MIDGIVDSLPTLIKSFAETIPKITQSLIPAIIKLTKGIAKGLIDNAPIILDAIKEIAVQITVALYEGLSGQKAGAEQINSIRGMFDGLLNSVLQVAKGIGSALSGAFKFISPIIPKIAGLLSFLGNNIKVVLPIIASLIGAVKGFKVFKSLQGLFGKGGESKSLEKNPLGGLVGMLKNMAKMKTKVILKGIGNMSIVLGALAVLAIAFAGVSWVINQFSNMRDIFALVGIVGALGIVGVAITSAMILVGNIPISTVLKGIANMAIVLGALAVMTIVLGAVSMIPFDLGRIAKLVILIGLVGTVGSILSIFAGIVGIIPFPLVLQGLGSIATVLGALTAVIAAFGALDQIPGFRDFLERGGQVLVQIFDTLGQW